MGITKAGKQRNQLATVLNPTWNNGVKVMMLTGPATDEIKSYSYDHIILHGQSVAEDGEQVCRKDLPCENLGHSHVVNDDEMFLEYQLGLAASESHVNHFEGNR